MANKVAISEALNTLAKGVKVTKEDKKVVNENLNKEPLKESSFDSHHSIAYDDLIDELVDRIDEADLSGDNVADAIFETIDSGMIYNDDQWTAIMEVCSPNEVINCLSEKGIDVWATLFEDVYAELQNRGLVESCQKESCKNEECQTCEAADVTDQVIIDRREPGAITKLHGLRDQGYKTLWTGDGKICLAKPKEIKEELEDNFSKKTNQGWEIIKKFKDLDDGRMHVIAKRNTSFYPYAVGLGYNEKTGSWGQGMYDYDTAEEAEDALRNNNRYHPYNVEEIKEAISPEDKADSDVIRDVAKRSWARKNAKISKEEQDVLNKHGLVRDSDKYLHGTILKDLGDGKRRVLTGPNDWTDNPNKDSDKMNYADRARKIDKRDYAKNVNYSFYGKDFGEKERNKQAYNMSRDVVDMKNALKDRKYAKDDLARKDDPEGYYNKQISKAKSELDRAKRAKKSDVEWNERKLKGSQNTIDTLLKRK